MVGVAIGRRQPVDTTFRSRFNLTEADAMKLQYYARSAIVLARVISDTDQRLASGRVVRVRGTAYEVVEIKRGTPGVATSMSPDTITVSFEPNCEIKFRATGSSPVNVGAPLASSGPFRGMPVLYEFDSAGVEYCGVRYERQCIVAGRATFPGVSPYMTWPCRSSLDADFQGDKPTEKKRVAPGQRIDKQ
jgi:hypothetical protein